MRPVSADALVRSRRGSGPRSERAGVLKSPLGPLRRTGVAAQVIAHNLARWTARLGRRGNRDNRDAQAALAPRRTAHPLRPGWTLERWPWAGQWAAALALRALPLPA